MCSLWIINCVIDLDVSIFKQARFDSKFCNEDIHMFVVAYAHENRLEKREGNTWSPIQTS